MGRAVIRSVDPARDADAVQDLCLRAADYITLETGAPPPPDYASKLLAEAPPALPPEDVLAFCAEQEGKLAAVVTCLRNFYQTREWYMGLLLVDPAARGAGLGARMAGHVFDLARAQGASCIRVAVLDANPRGRRFWQREGFVPERAVPADPDGDGHARHVLKLNWEEAPCD
ncbi:GNAT family N-acetyltransferase [Sulfitobacter sp. HNIBRBA2951]|uniref:GNAT family N-acetyltransferase n=1 Tax=Sulfitobacter aquimarinus TaxID=3158557 RepID=UPI0032DF7178